MTPSRSEAAPHRGRRVPATVAVIGLGRFGSALALELMRHGAQVMGIDIAEEVVQDLNGQLGSGVRADATREQVLRQVTRGLLRSDPDLGRADHPEDTAALQLLAQHLAQHVLGYRGFYTAALTGPGGYAVRTAMADHLTGVLYGLRGQQQDGTDGALRERFAIHGLLGMLTETLTDHECGDLHAIVTGLQRELAA